MRTFLVVIILSFLSWVEPIVEHAVQYDYNIPDSFGIMVLGIFGVFLAVIQDLKEIAD